MKTMQISFSHFIFSFAYQLHKILSKRAINNGLLAIICDISFFIIIHQYLFQLSL